MIITILLSGPCEEDAHKNCAGVWHSDGADQPITSAAEHVRVCKCACHEDMARKQQRITRPCPRLQGYCEWVAILSHGEAAGCIRDYKAGLAWSSEAVNHYGGTRAVITRAIAMRHTIRSIDVSYRVAQGSES